MRAPAVPRLPRAGLVLVALLAACGPAGAQTTPTATPLPTSQLQERYQAAAAAYNTAEGPVWQAENEYCAPTAPTADVMHCETALSADRQATITFDTALRALTFPPSARGVVTQLLSDDAQLETVLEQEAMRLPGSSPSDWRCSFPGAPAPCREVPPPSPRLA